MKQSAIKEIFDRLEDKWENKRTERENMENLDTICAAEAELKKQLTPEQFALHKKFVDALELDFCEEVDFYFSEGFKLGLRIGMECIE